MVFFKSITISVLLINFWIQQTIRHFIKHYQFSYVSDVKGADRLHLEHLMYLFDFSLDWHLFSFCLHFPLKNGFYILWMHYVVIGLGFFCIEMGEDCHDIFLNGSLLCSSYWSKISFSVVNVWFSLFHHHQFIRWILSCLRLTRIPAVPGHAAPCFRTWWSTHFAVYLEIFRF